MKIFEAFWHENRALEFPEFWVGTSDSSDQQRINEMSLFWIHEIFFP
jgi:hypothetical protein